MNDLAARCHGWAQFQAMENHYNLLYREDEWELIPICKQMGVSLIPYSPLAAGHLTRPEWTTDTLRSRTDRVAMGKYDRTKGSGDRVPGAHAGRALRRKDAANRIGLALVRPPSSGPPRPPILTMLRPRSMFG